MEDNKIVLCGSNAYEQRYYFNDKFIGMPNSIKDELKIICVLFTEEIGGVFTIVFEEDGILALETTFAEEDIIYDEIGSGLLVGQIRKNKQELLQSLSLYYKVVVLGQKIEEIELEE